MTKLQMYFGQSLSQVKAAARAEERQACHDRLITYAAALPDASAAAYRHAAGLLLGKEDHDQAPAASA